ncbi:RrF2 family transcriptional regulator [Yokenella regensburgei]|jgi:Rrf2 family protein|uniref:HTH-type transcriptional repressor NsrR n=1 Tax=Yokenella regensburgei TaxID=158877 RepID=A0AB38FSI9_9ENTR|nr:Rrf2 family transcriptional regulator [Yokenella regensburgei]EHM46484.1 transcriptional regulator, Rrf2 family [Yokenella regensburgei ATCC 43003]KFD20551.1 putative NADH dehydrogenase transcriptional regulator [Yokenella regensburgei ATCC 49455]SQA60881.1 HTH-type transcriptional repressor NsrR [Yokenella regensburgei]SQA67062.1 HTH-type transcriptional repressor NsrR [Yokenella regensburgei]SUQ05506.1 HTH-type transcriptional repressor NsrR [Yokenella regensburgei]
MAFYSSGVEYGIHSLMCMVDARGEAREMSVREMAELQGVPYDYLAKIFTRLSRGGLVSSSEGKGGGFRLARAAELITVLDVVHAIDGEKNMFECREVRQRLALFDEQPPEWVCDGPCGVRSVMDSAQQRMEEELARHTILDLARKMYRKAPDTFVVEVQEWIADRRVGR